MYNVIFLIDAIYDIEMASEWYSIQQPGLDTKFKEHIFATIENISSETIIHKPKYRGLSRVFVKKFPYTIYFKKNKQMKQIIIYGALHKRQNIDNLNKRI